MSQIVEIEIRATEVKPDDYLPALGRIQTVTHADIRQHFSCFLIESITVPE